MLRTLLLLIALVVLIVIALVATGTINLTQSSDGTVSIETRDVEVGTTTRNVNVPVVKIESRQVEVPSVGLEQENVTGNAQ